MKFRRVGPKCPCLVCQKPDWCLRAKDDSASICARVESEHRIPNSGWLHRHRRDGKRRRRRTFRVGKSPAAKPSVDWPALAAQCEKAMSADDHRRLSEYLGVSASSIKRLGVGKHMWTRGRRRLRCWTFPMRNPQGGVVGIRLRPMNGGRKFCITGSKSGMFVPSGLTGKGPLLIAEGDSDVLAAVDLRFDAIGRPGCMACVDMTVRFCRGRDVAIVADNDPPQPDGRRPGLDGARRLANWLALVGPSVKIILPPEPFKDLRKWYRCGLTRDELLTEIEKTEPLDVEICCAV